MKHVIIQLSGGVGNQLFQLANAYQLSINFQRNLLICKNNSSNRNVYWDTVLSKFNDKLISIDKFKNMKRTAKIYRWAMTHFEYKQIVLEDNVECYCIEGYYQSYKYFDINSFEQLLTFNYKCENSNSNNIALHIRRGDYLKPNFHKVLSLDYYYNSLKEIIPTLKLGNNENIQLHIFSDDIGWCKQHFKYENIDPNYITLDTDIDELYMLSKFKNIIIGNSTFSWWAAYLNNTDSKKTVYCPKNWFNNGCHLNTKDLRPNGWNIMDDDMKYTHATPFCFDSKQFNIISLGSACCMVHNIHNNIYKNLGPLFRQPENATNFFDWLITDFKYIAYVFDNLMFKDDSFLCVDNFTFKDINATSQQLVGGWSRVYKKVEFKIKDVGSMISLHDVKKDCRTIPNEFIEKYKRRFDRLYHKIQYNDTIHFMHCFDFQWLSPCYPLICEIEKIFEACKTINPICKVKIYFFVHPKYHNNPIFEEYKFIDNVEVCYLKNKGFHSDWKADNLTFDDFLHL